MSDPANHSDPLVQAILGLLGALPLKWRQVDNDDMTAVEQEAFKLLTAAGLVERRFALRLSLLGHPVCVEAVITVTGECGLVEAVEPVAGTAWEAWAEAYLKRKNENTEPRPRFHCEKTGPEKARLTDQGQLALKDIRDGKGAIVLDFVYHRGPVFEGRAVPGEGRAERIRTTAVSPPSSLDVQVKNLPEVSGPLAAINETLNKMLEQRAAASTGEAPGETHEVARRARWPLQRTEEAVRDYLQRHQAKLNRLGQACLDGRADAAAEFLENFGPTAIARGINELLQITDPRAQCRRQDVSRTKAYQDLVRPFQASPPQPPEGWVSTEDTGSAFQDILNDIQGAEES